MSLGEWAACCRQDVAGKARRRTAMGPSAIPPGNFGLPASRKRSCEPARQRDLANAIQDMRRPRGVEGPRQNRRRAMTGRTSRDEFALLGSTRRDTLGSGSGQGCGLAKGNGPHETGFRAGRQDRRSAIGASSPLEPEGVESGRSGDTDDADRHESARSAGFCRAEGQVDFACCRKTALPDAGRCRFGDSGRRQAADDCGRVRVDRETCRWRDRGPRRFRRPCRDDASEGTGASAAGHCSGTTFSCGRQGIPAADAQGHALPLGVVLRGGQSHVFVAPDSGAAMRARLCRRPRGRASQAHGPLPRLLELGQEGLSRVSGASQLVEAGRRRLAPLPVQSWRLTRHVRCDHSPACKRDRTNHRSPPMSGSTGPSGLGSCTVNWRRGQRLRCGASDRNSRRP